MLEVSVLPAFGCVLRHTSTGTLFLINCSTSFYNELKSKNVEYFCIRKCCKSLLQNKFVKGRSLWSTLI